MQMERALAVDTLIMLYVFPFISYMDHLCTLESSEQPLKIAHAQGPPRIQPRALKNSISGYGPWEYHISVVP